MDLNKIASHAQTYAKFGKEYVDDAQEGLMFRDANGDGDVTAIEMYKDLSEGWGSIFEGNKMFSQRAEELNLAQGEIYARYAGEDGKLDKFEFVEALNSDEMDVLIEQLWEMKALVEAENGETDKNTLSHYDVNWNGDVSTIEIYKSKSDLYSKVFENNEESKVKAEDIAQRQAEILSKYAGDDGVLSSEEFAEAVDSLEYKKTVREYMDLDM